METAEEFTRSAPTYGTLIAVGAGVTSLAFVFEWRPGQVFLLATGGTYTAIILIAFVFHLWQSYCLFNHDMAVRKHDLEAMAQQSESPAPAPVVAENWTKTASGVKLTIKHYDNPPPYEFLAFLFENANGGGQIPTERAIGEMGLKLGLWNTNDSDAWLTMCDEQHITEKMRQTKNGNAPRRIAEGMTLDEACKRFGLPPALPSPE